MEIASFSKLLQGAAIVAQLCWSLLPFYRPPDRVAEPLLVGSYQASIFGGQGLWRFESLYNPGEYGLSFASGDAREEYHAVLFGVSVSGRQATFLDLTPSGPGSGSRLHGDLALAGHVVFRVSFGDEGISLAPLSPDWAREDLALRRRPLHEQDGRPLLLEPTPALRTLLRRALADPGAFDGPYRLTRVPSRPARGS